MKPLLNKHFISKSILCFVFFSISIILNAESNILLNLSERFSLSQDKNKYQERQIINNLEIIKLFKNNDLIFNFNIYRDIHNSDKWKYNFYSSFIYNTQYIIYKPYLYSVKKNKIESYNDYGLTIFFERELLNKNYDIGVEFCNNNYYDLNHFSSNHYNFWLNQKYFFHSSSLHYSAFLSYKDFYNYTKSNSKLIYLHNQLMLTFSLNQDSGLSLSIYNNSALKKPNLLLYPFDYLEDEYSYELTAGYISYSRIIHKLFYKITVEYGVKNYLEVIQYNAKHNDFITLIYYSDFPIINNLMFYNDIKFTSYNTIKVNQIEYLMNISISWKIF